MHHWCDPQTIDSAKVLGQRLIISWLEVVVLGTIYSAVLAQLNLGFFHGNLDHGNDIISLVGHQRSVLERFIVELNCKTVLIEVFVHTLDSGEMI